MADRELDVRGLSCPLPILKTRKALDSMRSGEKIRILATDPGSVLDLKAFSAQSGNSLLESSESDGVYTFLLQKA